MSPEAWAAWAAAGGLLLTGYQICLNRRDANRRTTLDLLLRVEERNHGAIRFTAEKAHRDILEYYCREQMELSAAAEAYIALLDSLDILALAIKKDIAEDGMGREWIVTIVESEMVTRTFLDQLRSACSSPQAYEHLYELIGSERYAGRPPAEA